MPRKKTASPVRNAAASRAASFIIAVRHRQGATRVGVTGLTTLAEVKRTVLSEGKLGKSTFVLCYPTRSDTLANEECSLASIGVCSHGEILFLEPPVASVSPVVGPPTPPSKKRLRLPMAHSARSSNADDLARAYLIAAADSAAASKGTKAYCMFTGAAAVHAVEKGKYSITSSGFSTADRSDRRPKLTVKFKGNSGKSHETVVPLLAVPFVVEVFEGVRRRSGTKRRKARCSSLAALSIIEIASRSPPLFWSIVYAASEGSLPGAMDETGRVLLEDAVRSVVVQADASADVNV